MQLVLAEDFEFMINWMCMRITYTYTEPRRQSRPELYVLRHASLEVRPGWTDN
jgi:hypothetical protein